MRRSHSPNFTITFDQKMFSLEIRSDTYGYVFASFRICGESIQPKRRRMVECTTFHRRRCRRRRWKNFHSLGLLSSNTHLYRMLNLHHHGLSPLYISCIYLLRLRPVYWYPRSFVSFLVFLFCIWLFWFDGFFDSFSIDYYYYQWWEEFASYLLRMRTRYIP